MTRTYWINRSYQYTPPSGPWNSSLMRWDSATSAAPCWLVMAQKIYQEDKIIWCFFRKNLKPSKKYLLFILIKSISINHILSMLIFTYLMIEFRKFDSGDTDETLSSFSRVFAETTIFIIIVANTNRTHARVTYKCFYSVLVILTMSCEIK